jgi:hypothetical protein
MNRRDLTWFFGLELFAIFWAGLVFSLVHNHFVAGLLAGSYFIVSAALMLRWAWRWPDKWRSLTLYPLALHLFGVALPMVIMRLIHADVEFSEITIWGLSGPEFHALSGKIFAVLIVATLIDWVRVGLRPVAQPDAQN